MTRKKENEPRPSQVDRRRGINLSRLREALSRDGSPPTYIDPSAHKERLAELLDLSPKQIEALEVFSIAQMECLSSALRQVDELETRLNEEVAERLLAEAQADIAIDELERVNAENERLRKVIRQIGENVSLLSNEGSFNRGKLRLILDRLRQIYRNELGGRFSEVFSSEVVSESTETILNKNKRRDSRIKKIARGIGAGLKAGWDQVRPKGKIGEDGREERLTAKDIGLWFGGVLFGTVESYVLSYFAGEALRPWAGAAVRAGNVGLFLWANWKIIEKRRELSEKIKERSPEEYKLEQKMFKIFCSLSEALPNFSAGAFVGTFIGPILEQTINFSVQEKSIKKAESESFPEPKSAPTQEKIIYEATPTPATDSISSVSNSVSSVPKPQHYIVHAPLIASETSSAQVQTPDLSFITNGKTYIPPGGWFIKDFRLPENVPDWQQEGIPKSQFTAWYINEILGGKLANVQPGMLEWGKKLPPEAVNKVKAMIESPDYSSFLEAIKDIKSS